MNEVIMPSISDTERTQRLKAYTSISASSRIEGLEADPAAKVIFQRYIEGDLTLDQMGAAIDELNDRDYGPIRLSGDNGS